MTQELTEVLFISKQKRIFYALSTPFHWISRKVFGTRYFSKEIPSPRKILICNTATLGDLFLTTALIPPLKRAYPDARIDFLVSPSSRVVVDKCPGIHTIYTLEPWLKNGDCAAKKIAAYCLFHLVKKRPLVRLLKKESYDIAINAYPFFSEVISIFLHARIPTRIGFDAIGYRILFSHAIAWEEGKYLPHLYKKILLKMGIQPHLEDSSPWISKTLPSLQVDSSPYVIFHMCSADKRKDLPADFWEILSKKLAFDKPIYFTGKGDTERQFIQSVCSVERQNLCGQLSWEQLLVAIKDASLVVTVDTVIAHIAAAYKTPHVIFYRSTPDPDLWRPEEVNNLAFVQWSEKLEKRIHRRDEQLIWVGDFCPDRIEEAIRIHFPDSIMEKTR